jgi:hypothetical protein
LGNLKSLETSLYGSLVYKNSKGNSKKGGINNTNGVWPARLPGEAGPGWNGSEASIRIQP